MRYPKVYEVMKYPQVDNETMVTIKEFYGSTRDVFGLWHSKEICELFGYNVAEIRYFPGINHIHLTLPADSHLPNKEGGKHETD